LTKSGNTCVANTASPFTKLEVTAQTFSGGTPTTLSQSGTTSIGPITLTGTNYFAVEVRISGALYMGCSSNSLSVAFDSTTATLAASASNFVVKTLPLAYTSGSALSITITNT